MVREWNIYMLFQIIVALTTLTILRVLGFLP